MKKIIFAIICAVGIFIAVFIFKQDSNKNTPYINPIELERVKKIAEQEAAKQPSSLQKGNDALIKYNILSIRAEAGKLTANGGYQSLCKNEVLNDAIASIKPHISELLKMENVTDQNSAGIICVSSFKSYVVSIQVNPPNLFETLRWCADSTGYVGRGLANKEKIVCNKE